MFFTLFFSLFYFNFIWLYLSGCLINGLWESMITSRQVCYGLTIMIAKASLEHEEMQSVNLMCNDDRNIDHRRWSKKMLSLGVPTFTKKHTHVSVSSFSAFSFQNILSRCFSTVIFLCSSSSSQIDTDNKYEIQFSNVAHS